jgi:hypothetical protein
VVFVFHLIVRIHNYSNVHEVVKTVIVHQEDLFSGDDSGMMYEKCILEDRYAYIFMKEGISEYFDFNS